VGGTSLFPWLQSQVQEGLGTKLDFSIDPITVVARGAAVFAGSLRMPESSLPVAAGTFGLELQYEPVGTDTAPMVGGKLKHPREGSLEGFTIEFVEMRTQWRSGRIRLPANGAFMTELHADKGRKCEYAIEVCEPKGTKVPCSPDRLSYTVGMVIGNAPLTHSLGVAMANNKMDVFFKKGAPLPDRAMHTHVQAIYVPRGTKRGQRGDAIRIFFVEGENEDKADRNRKIGCLEIWADDPKFKRDVPAGSEVEITIEIDPSRLLTTQAYVPILDETFSGVFNPKITAKSAAELQAEYEQELNRLATLREQAEQADDRNAKDAIATVEAGQVVEQAESLVIAATRGAEDAVAEGDRKLLDLKTAVDGAEDALAWPNMVNEARSGLQAARQIVEQHGASDEKARLSMLAGELDRGINAHDAHTVRAKAEAIEDLRLRVVWRRPETWVGCLEYLDGQRPHMRDQKMAEKLLAQARRSVEGNDLEGVKAAVRQLFGLLPPDEQAEADARGFGGTTMRQG